MEGKNKRTGKIHVYRYINLSFSFSFVHVAER